MTTTANRTADRFARQLGIYNPEHRNDSVTFIGVGGIGSFAAFGAAKLGIPNITLIDPDAVEDHNIPNQFYDDTQIGEHKVEAIALHLQAHALEPRINTWGLKLPDPDVRLSGLVVSGLDSMQARHDIWHECIKLNPRVPRYFDARISGEFIMILAPNPTDMNDIAAYERDCLYSDEEGEELMCTERGIIDVGMQVGSLLTRMVRRHFTGEEIPKMTLFNQNTLTPTQSDWMPVVSS